MVAFARKVAIYCRVSTNEQTTDNQEMRLVEYCVSKGWNYDIFKEVESSRKTRPIKQSLLTKLRNHEYDAIIVYKLDRYARSSTELILEIKELTDKGIAFISLTENLDFSSAAGKLQFEILSALSFYEREIIRERTIEGIRRARQQGKQIGRPKGSKDKTSRPKSGYFLREAKKRKEKDETKGIYNPIKSYIK